MKVVLDSYALLAAIGRHREVFAGIDALVSKQATALLTGQLKHKSMDLAHLRALRTAIGSEAFELFLDTADEKLLKAIAKKTDPHASVTKAGDADALRPHLIALADGRAPAEKVSKSTGSSKKTSIKSSPSVAGEDRPHAIATKPPGRR